MIALVEPIFTEFQEEVPSVRRMLERIPTDKLAWKPHGKSRSLGELAFHVANIPGLVEKIATLDEFSPGSGPPTVVESVDQIRAAFEKNVKTAEETFGRMTEQSALGDWRLVFRGKEILRKPRIHVLRTNVLNHLYHHRGQLSVYLRLLDVPVPFVYGPTADENPFA
jgi:uncharacterized damage-inducible protein DinB